jgi:hypothetical protein
MEKGNINNIEGIEHLYEIRKRLWQDPIYGSVSVFIGAGFSRNAKPKRTNSKQYPNWSDLSTKMIDILYQNISQKEKEKKYSQAEVPAQILRLANEYETSLGQNSLDNLLLSEIPDNDFNPSHLHEELLELPWADVFTTNYDTLLERTLPHIVNRKYNVILTVEDIQSKRRPRIIKLHGSFPSTRPFIITEDQYREYPIKFAPFVNTIKQSLLETTLCLIGFSGDDPNFLAWTGWIRDNLGENTHPIYLIGLLDTMSATQKRLLEKRRIIPIDLSPMLTNDDGDFRHKHALQKLFDFLKENPSEKLKWPYDYGFNDFPYMPARYEKLSKRLPEDNISDVIHTWKKTIQEYPGWVILPYKIRNSLSERFSHKTNDVLLALKELNPPLDILLAYTYSWFNRHLLELFNNLIIIEIEKIIEKYDPFQLSVEQTKITHLSNPDFDWANIKKYWVYLVFTLLEDAREEQDAERFSHFADIIKQVMGDNQEWQAEYRHEISLFHLNRFDITSLIEVLRQWEEFPDNPFGLAQKASILAEIGQIPDAIEKSEQALSKIRSFQGSDTDYSYLSQEGLVMVLRGMMDDLSCLEQSRRKTNGKRWDELEKYKCNINDDRVYWELQLGKPRPHFTKPFEIKVKFDPGRYTRTQHFGDNELKKFSPAYSYLKLHDAGALPVRCGNMVLDNSTLRNAIEWIYLFHPRWAISMLVRSGNDKNIDIILSRSFVAIMGNKHYQYIKDVYINALKQGIKIIEDSPPESGLSMGGRFYFERIPLITEIVSRLTIRMTTDELLDLFNVCISWYKSLRFRSTHDITASFYNLWARVTFALPLRTLVEHLDQILDIPIPDKDTLPSLIDQECNDLTAYIKVPLTIPQLLSLTKYENMIDELVQKAKENDGIVRKLALQRLNFLRQLSAYSREIDLKLSEALWAKLDKDMLFPSESPYFAWGYLFMPHSDKYNITEILKTKILKDEFMPIAIGTDDGWTIYGNNKEGDPDTLSDLILNSTENIFSFHPITRWANIEWTDDEIVQIFRKVETVWQKNKDYIAHVIKRKTYFDNSDKNRIHSQMDHIKQVFGTILLPRFANFERSIKNDAIKLFDEFESFEISITSILPTHLFLNDPASPNSGYDVIVKKLTMALNSIDENEIKDAFEAIIIWKIYCSKQILKSEPPEHLYNGIFNTLIQRSAIKTQPALMWIESLINRHPQLVSSAQIETVCITLEFLLDELALPTLEDLISGKNRTGICSIEEWPNYLDMASKLARAVYQYQKINGGIITKTILKWQEFCSNHILPEVRKKWEFIN